MLVARALALTRLSNSRLRARGADNGGKKASRAAEAISAEAGVAEERGAEGKIDAAHVNSEKPARLGDHADARAAGADGCKPGAALLNAEPGVGRAEQCPFPVAQRLIGGLDPALAAQIRHAGAEPVNLGRLCPGEKGGVASGIGELPVPVAALRE